MQLRIDLSDVAAGSIAELGAKIKELGFETGEQSGTDNPNIGVITLNPPNDVKLVMAKNLIVTYGGKILDEPPDEQESTETPPE